MQPLCKLPQIRLLKQPLMKERSKDPDRKARTNNYPQREMFLETNVGYEKEQNRRQNTKQRTLRIGGHQSDIAGVVGI